MPKHLSNNRSRREANGEKVDFLKPKAAISLRRELSSGRQEKSAKRRYGFASALALLSCASFAAFAVFGFADGQVQPLSEPARSPQLGCVPKVGQILTGRSFAAGTLGGVSVVQFVCLEKKYRLVVDATRRQILQVITL
jgi:hypothetical protein